MKLYDVTRPLSPASPVYPGDLVPSFAREERDGYLITALGISSHSGTHIDAPSHFLKGGITVDEIPLQNLIGKCTVIDLSGAGNRITGSQLERRIGGAKRIFLKTSFSGAGRFAEDFPAIDSEAAQVISARKILCVGIDSMSIEPFRSDGSVHRELLGNGCTVIELLDLSGVEEGDYGMVALPLRLGGLDGSPARVLLFGEGSGIWT
ncbi:MAG TPA: cyclase family protein [Methanoregula sp.]|nr:cyclase family protein [Methanoregula sp.]